MLRVIFLAAFAGACFGLPRLAAADEDEQPAAIEPISDADKLQLADDAETEGDTRVPSAAEDHVQLLTRSKLASFNAESPGEAEELPAALSVSEAGTVHVAEEPKAEEIPSGDAAAKTARTDSLSRGYYSNYAPKGYYPRYVYAPNYPPKYPRLMGYGFGIKGYMLYQWRYIFGHPSGYLNEHCPYDAKYGPVYYGSGRPVKGPIVLWRHYGFPPKPQQPASDSPKVGAANVTVTPQDGHSP